MGCVSETGKNLTDDIESILALHDDNGDNSCSGEIEEKLQKAIFQNKQRIALTDSLSRSIVDASQISSIHLAELVATRRDCYISKMDCKLDQELKNTLRSAPLCNEEEPGDLDSLSPDLFHGEMEKFNVKLLEQVKVTQCLNLINDPRTGVLSDRNNKISHKRRGDSRPTGNKRFKMESRREVHIQPLLPNSTPHFDGAPRQYNPSSKFTPSRGNSRGNRGTRPGHFSGGRGNYRGQHRGRGNQAGY